MNEMVRNGTRPLNLFCRFFFKKIENNTLELLKIH